MYDVFVQLLQKYGVTPYKVSKETGVSQASLSDWKNGKSVPKVDKLQKIADYFGVPLNYLMTGINEHKTPEPALTPKDERDIGRRLEQTLADLESEQVALMFDGDPMDDATKELLRISLENSIRIAKIYAKRKYTPKKYRKE